MLCVIMLDVGAVGQGNEELSGVGSTKSTEKPAVTSADTLNFTKAALQTPFTTEPAEGLTGEGKKQREEDTKNASKLKGYIEDKLASGIGNFEAAANVLVQSSFDLQVKAMALDMLASDKNILAIAMKMRPWTMAYILNTNAKVAKKALSALIQDGAMEQAVGILEQMNCRKAAEALRGVKDDVILTIAMKMRPWHMANILSASVDLAKKALSALFQDGTTEQAAHILEQMNGGKAAEALLGMEDAAIVAIAMQMDSLAMADILEVNDQAAEKILLALCVKGEAEEENWKNQMQQTAEIFQNMEGREKFLNNTPLCQYRDILLKAIPVKNRVANDNANRLHGIDKQTKNGENNGKIQPETNSTASLESDENPMSAKTEKSFFFSVWLRMITATVGFGALAGIVAIIALEVAVTVISLILVALVLVAIAVECASFALEKRESNSDDAAK
ncbi:MAG: hypothetical protein LBI69_05075 [Puniceicoccales bacterium]|nr:hypothetical protein [Puniceicoccales bacterium]